MRAYNRCAVQKPETRGELSSPTLLLVWLVMHRLPSDMAWMEHYKSLIH